MEPPKMPVGLTAEREARRSPKRWLCRQPKRWLRRQPKRWLRRLPKEGPELAKHDE
jgi:hypothetical protein